MQREQARDLVRNVPVLLRVRAFPATTPGIEACACHVEPPTQRRHAVLRVVRFDEGEDVAFRAEQNRMAFFRFFTEYREMRRGF